MLKPALTRLLRRGLILVFLCTVLVAASSSSVITPTQANNPNYFYSVTIVSLAPFDTDCWQVFSQGAGCSNVSFSEARNEAITDAVNNMWPPCSWQPFRIDWEYGADGSTCTP